MKWHSWAAIAMFALSTELLHRSMLDNFELPDIPLAQAIPSIEALRWTSLGYRELAADINWFRAISEFGISENHKQGYPNVAPLIDRVVGLDPYYKTAYIFAGTALTLNMFDIPTTNDLLRKGMTFRPELWELPYYLGFNQYYFLGDFTAAAKNLGHAASFADAPDHVGLLATRIAAQSQDPGVGIRYVESILAQISDDDENAQIRYEYEHRRDLLRREQDLRWLQKAIETFETNEQPATWADLLRSGTLLGIPEDPVGGTYILTSTRTVGVASPVPRLRIYGRTAK